MYPQIYPKISTFIDLCAWWVHILVRAPGDERYLYRFSIHGSIDSGPCVLVSTCGTCSWSTQKSPFFGQFRHFGAKKAIFEENSTRNIFSSTFRMKTTKVWKVFKIFQTFRKIWKKGLGAPPTHPNPQLKFLKNFNFSKFSLVGLGVLGVPQALFFKIFGKFEKF